MRLLGLDLGERRIGLAVSDASGMLASPAGYLVRSRLQQDISRILDIARRREAGGIVVGIPYTQAGELGPQARRVQGFIRHLRKSTTLPVYTVDERFTSFEAEELLRDAGQQPSRRRGAVDAAAATLILQRFLDQAKHPHPFGYAQDRPNLPPSRGKGLGSLPPDGGESERG